MRNTPIDGAILDDELEKRKRNKKRSLLRQRTTDVGADADDAVEKTVRPKKIVEDAVRDADAIDVDDDEKFREHRRDRD